MGSTKTAGARRLTAMATAAVLAAGVSACSSSKSGSSAGGSDKGSFTYWSMWKATEPQAKVLQAAVTQFTADTGIKVNVQFIGRDVKKQIGPAEAAGKAPDLWDMDDGAIYTDLASEGKATDLSPVLDMQIPGESQKVSDVIPAKYFQQEQKDPKGGRHWIMPYEVTLSAIFYNAADPNLQAAMPSQPATWADFVKVCAALKAKNEACIASEGEDAWTNGLYFDYLMNAAGVNFKNVVDDKSGAAWDNPAILGVAEDLEQLVKGGYVINGYDATKYPAQETNWANGKAAFYMDGNYVTDEVAKEIPGTWKFGTMLPPGASSPNTTLFGFSVPAGAKHVSQAEQFIAYFLAKKNLSGISTTAGNLTPRADIPAPEPLADAEKIMAAGTPRQDQDGAPGDWNAKVWTQDFLDFWHGKTDASGLVAKLKSDTVQYWKTQG